MLSRAQLLFSAANSTSLLVTMLPAMSKSGNGKVLEGSESREGMHFPLL